MLGLKRTCLSLIFCIFLNAIFAQNKIVINKSCSYYGEKPPTNVYTFSSDGEAQSILNMILSASGLSSNFKLVAGDVPNAAAVILINSKSKEPERYIIYNQTFMYNIEKRINYWASVSILAHEIGHHLNGHSLMPGGSRPSIELEADKFSGFVLATLGANLEDAQAAINSLVSEEGSLSHPPKSARLAAIANGWHESTSSKTNKSNRNSSNGNLFSLSIGQLFGGGIIIHLDESSVHGLIVSQKDIEYNIEWNDAVKKYTNYNIDGHNDWVLPTLEELKYIHKYKNQIGGFSDCLYWTSSNHEKDIYSFWSVNFKDGDYSYWSEIHKKRANVRLVRHF